MKNSVSFSGLAQAMGVNATAQIRPVVCIQGLGFVGSAMATAVANARDEAGAPLFNVIGVDLDTVGGKTRVAALNQGRFPFRCPDRTLAAALTRARKTGSLIATTDATAYELAEVTIVDIDLDLDTDNGSVAVGLERFRTAIRTLGMHMAPSSLIIVETTVPPGTCAKVAEPEIAAALAERGFPGGAILLAHSYERVMPGPDYLDSIINYWRVYAGQNEQAADVCERFLRQVINTAEFPLTRLSSITASETAKVLENSYRATTIAFMEEWARFAEAVGIDMFEIVDAIRSRPTHTNIRQPGFGVGGYCVPKDPLFGSIAARQVFDRPDLKFPFCEAAVATNRAMPLVSLDRVEALLGGGLAGKRLLLLGVTYRADVADTRRSPSEAFVCVARERGALVTCHDPIISHWPELDLSLPDTLPNPGDFDAVVFAVAHALYKELDVAGWLGRMRPLVFDANRVLDDDTRRALRQRGVTVASIGRGGPL